MQKTVVFAVLLLCAAGIAAAVEAPPARAALSTGQALKTADQHPLVSQVVVALQAQVRAAFDRGDAASAREMERQVQAQLIQEQRIVSHPVRPVAARPSGGAGCSFESDRLIAPGNQSAISTDYEQDPDGTMWAAIAMEADSNTWICRSTDHGASWNVVVSFHWTPLHAITKIKLVVGPGDSGFVYVFENVPAEDGNLIVGRFNKDGTGGAGWMVQAGADTITDFTACRDFMMGGDYWLYAIAYNGARPGNSPPAYLYRSTDYGQTWALVQGFSNANLPSVAFGAGSWGYLAVVPVPHLFKGAIPVGVTNAWASPGSWTYSQWMPDTFLINDAAIAPAFTMPESTATVWLAYTHNINGTVDYDVLSAHTNDARNGGWVGPDTIACTSNPEGYVDLKHYTVAGSPYVNVSYVDIDMTNYYNNAYLGWAEASAPAIWHMAGPINQSVYTDWGFTTYPNIVYSPGGPGSGGGLVFADFNFSGTYFNAPWLTGVVEQPRVAGRSATILSVQPSIARGKVFLHWTGSATRLTVTDAAGRVLSDYANPAGHSLVWKGNVAAGTYFVRLVTSQGLATSRIVIQ